MNKRGVWLFVFAFIIIQIAGVFASVNEDVNENGIINVVDLGMVGMKIGSVGCNVGNNYCGRTDIDRGGYINVVDLGKVANAFGKVVTPSGLGNEKDLAMYSDKEVFLISDKNWTDVLPLVPMTVWTGTENCVNNRPYGGANDTCYWPTLIFHEEKNATTGNVYFDADSVIWFMLRYQPSKLTIIGDTPPELDNLLVASSPVGASLTADKIRRITASSYLSRWKSISDVVYSSNDYGTSVIAASYAALINAPLVIKGGVYDIASTFSGRNVTCVGGVAPSGVACKESYTMKELQSKYAQITRTDKIIATNFRDMDMKVASGTLNNLGMLKRSIGSMTDIFNKDSLASAFLAAGKKELIINVSKSDYKTNHFELSEQVQDTASHLFSNQFTRYTGLVNLNIGTMERDYQRRVSNELFDLDYGIKASPKGGLAWVYESTITGWPTGTLIFNNLTSNFGSGVLSYSGYFEGYPNGFIYNFLEGAESSLSKKYCTYYSWDLVESHRKVLLLNISDICMRFAVYNNSIAWQNNTNRGTMYIMNITNKASYPVNFAYKLPAFSIFMNDKKIVYTQYNTTHARYDSYIYDIISGVTTLFDKNSSVLGFNNKSVLWERGTTTREVFITDIESGEQTKLSTRKISSFVSEFVPFMNNNRAFWASNETKRCDYAGNSCTSNSDCASYCSFGSSVCSAGQTRCGVDDFGICQKDTCKASGVGIYDANSKTSSVVDLGIPVPRSIAVLGNNLYYFLPKLSSILGSGLNNKGYLTIVSSQFIPHRRFGGSGMFLPTDSKEYGDIVSDDGKPDIYAGRIFGFTLSDTSSYIARDLIYNKLQRTNGVAFFGKQEYSWMAWAEGERNSFIKAGYNAKCGVDSAYTPGTNCTTAISKWPELWKGVEFGGYADHGSGGSAGIGGNALPDMNETAAFAGACATCESTGIGSFCSANLRRGAMAYVGAVETTSSLTCVGGLYGILSQNISLGQSWRYGCDDFTMLGDPSFYPIMSHWLV